MKRKTRWSVLIAAMLWSAMLPAAAQGVAAVRKQVEASLLVQGEITVDERGTIASYTFKDPDKLPAGVETFLRERLAEWEFEPPSIEGKSVKLRNSMRVLLVAKKLDEERFLMRVQAASFYPLSNEEGYEVRSEKMDPPRYPPAAAQGGAQGTVYLIVKVGRDGRVEDVVAEQVNLRVVATESMMRRLRGMFAESSIAAARKWQFTPPKRGGNATAEFWTLRVPVDYNMGTDLPRYGRWVSYIPGPRERASWLGQDLADTSPEAMAAGEPRQLGKDDLRLRTPLGEDS